ncbi:unnamed protein product [marine sediment metagenome]|uniref:S1 motif domain-containing protein n=1 Tax=marine sediment metagenome TaxID=412755 RepID=X1AA19_9ZZZZ
MVKSRTKFPKDPEFVLARVVEIEKQYVYVDLIDYEGLPSEKLARGMIHISEISSRWIKNVRNFVRINQVIVLRVLKVDEYKGHVDCSLRRVNSAQKDRRMKEHKYATKYENMLQFLADEKDMSLDEAYDLIGFPVLDLFTSYQEALEALKENGKDILEEIELDSDDIKNTYLQIIEENVEISTVTIIGKVKLSFITDNGIEQIKEALLGAMKVVEKPKPTRSINISYIGTPYYRLEIVSKDYIDAEGILSEALEIIQGEAEQYNGQFEFLRD